MNRLPFILAVMLLLLPVLYVGSYAVLAVPERGQRNWVLSSGTFRQDYRYGGDYAARFYWPLSQIDRTLRPGVWENPPFGDCGYRESADNQTANPAP